jgi:hypothetical protein
MFSLKVPYLHPAFSGGLWVFSIFVRIMVKREYSFENSFREFRTPVFQGLGCGHSELLKKEGF